MTNPRLLALNKGERAAAYKNEMAQAVAQATGADADALSAGLAQDRGYIVLAPLVDPGVARDLRDRFPEIAEEKREKPYTPKDRERVVSAALRAYASMATAASDGAYRRVPD